MLNDLVARLDVKSGQITEYLLPRTTNVRRVFVEETGPRPVLWVGSNHGASLVKGEPLAYALSLLSTKHQRPPGPGTRRRGSRFQARPRMRARGHCPAEAGCGIDVGNPIV